MYGTIYKQKGAKKQKWVYKSPPFGPDKKRIRKAFETEEEAQAFRNQFKQSMGRRTTGETIPGLTVQEAYEKWSRATFGTEEKVGLHSLRKLFCKILKDSGASWEEVRRIMGHSSIEMSQQLYYQLDDEQYENIANNIPLI